MSVLKVKSLINLVLTALVFHSEGEIQTLSGYSADKYRKLLKDIENFETVDQITIDQAKMFVEAASMLNSLNRGRLGYYAYALGENYGEVFEEVKREVYPIILYP